MNKTDATVVIKVDAAGGAPFKYRGDGEFGQCVKEDGTIKLREADEKLKEADKALELGRVNLEFQLKPREVAVDGVIHSVEFRDEKSISFDGKEEPGGRGEVSPFSIHKSSPDESHMLHVFNANHVEKSYKYTLQVMFQGEESNAGDGWRHDPIIDNTGGGYLK